MKTFKYSFSCDRSFLWSRSGRQIITGKIEAIDENDAKKKLQLWKDFKNIKGLEFKEIVPFATFSTFDETNPPLEKPLRLIKYENEKEVIGWLNTSGKIYIPYSASEVPISQFKLYKLI